MVKLGGRFSYCLSLYMRNRRFQHLGVVSLGHFAALYVVANEYDTTNVMLFKGFITTSNIPTVKSVQFCAIFTCYASVTTNYITY